MDDIDSCETAVQKVQQITQDMGNGEYEADSEYESEEEDTPRIIEMYEMTWASLNWEPTSTHTHCLKVTHCAKHRELISAQVTY